MRKLAESIVETAGAATRVAVPFMDLKAQFRAVRDEVLRHQDLSELDRLRR